MAIQGSYNLDNALYSQAYAYKCWYNYNYGGNTLGISANDIGKITQTWKGELSNWQATAMDDENAYEIEDDDYSMALDDGYKLGQDKTGYDGGKNGMGARSALDITAGAAGAVVSSGALNSVGNYAIGNVGSKLVEKTAEKVSSKVGTAAANKVSEQGAGSSGSWIIGAPLALAQGTAYIAKKPNKEQKEACDELQNEMVNSQAALNAAQSDMSTYNDEIIALSDEAAVYNEDANEQIEEKKSEFDVYKATYEALMEKVEAGETLSEDEKSLLKELIPIMQELGVSINETSEETTDTTSEIYDEMSGYVEGFDNTAATVAEVQGVTDFAASFDEATKNNCVAEAVGQGLNAASGTYAATKAGIFAASGGIFTAWAWAFAGMGAAGAAMSATGVAQQTKWAGEVGNEISMRKDTQDLGSMTSEIYDESIDGYEGSMSTVEDLELLIPEDMEAPEEVPTVPEGEDKEEKPTATGFGLSVGSSGVDGNKDEKDKPI